ncbi:hypothetical protein DDB_G0275033 [Dictyostelium discoideum AX4]|uniref:VWFA domain-containing protein n=1 Tax=Dictyostelium discoideum TaxID=44689 RepID=Q86I68_DICDI|nr:hypothetical protein DDB_G0275033 [Dictyostelium discoideum AX4]EAL69797.1 hypothetical protein DDB_G0275033 [Dictyostelium discoideum AX4]|eukprot:XP_643851.1 hypothetical protein DDB_G0275033 [Dictyostelium discoideum AX4]
MNIQRQALKTEIKSLQNVESDKLYFSILVENTLNMALYNVSIKTFIQNLQKTQKESEIQIITYNEEVLQIFEFDQQPILLRDSIKEIKFSKTSNQANFGLALQECYKNIESFRSDTSISNIIIFSSGISSDDSSDGLVEIMSLENNFIYGIAGCGEEGVKNLQTLLPDIVVIPFSKNPSKDISNLLKSSDLNSEQGSSINCPINIEVFPHSNETQSIKDDLYLDIVLKPDGNTSCIPSGSKIKFLPSKYYSGYTIQIKNDILFGHPYEETIRLDYKKGQIEKSQYQNFPSHIEFNIELFNDKENIIEGFIWLNICYFLGDLKSKYRVSIGVEGGIGNGKSTCLNGFVNLFNPTFDFVEYFIANRSNGDHVTRSVDCTSLKEILQSKYDIHPVQESFKDIDIVWTDTWGFVDTDVELKHKAEGRIHHGTSKNDCLIQLPNEEYRIDCFIFVVSIRNFNDATAMSKIEKKIQEVIKVGITPLMAITFVDSLTKNVFQELLNKVNELSIQKSNTFIINNYTENETTKDISKDIQYLRLLTKAVQLCKIKNEKDLITQSKNQNQNLAPSKSNETSFLQSTINNIISPIKHTTTKQPIFSIEPKTITVTIDIIQDINSEKFLQTFEIEAILDHTFLELKDILRNEIDPNINISDWNLTKENGTILLDSSKLSSICKNLTIDSIKLVLKKKEKLIN